MSVFLQTKFLLAQGWGEENLRWEKKNAKHLSEKSNNEKDKNYAK